MDAERWGWGERRGGEGEELELPLNWEILLFLLHLHPSRGLGIAQGRERRPFRRRRLLASSATRRCDGSLRPSPSFSEPHTTSTPETRNRRSPARRGRYRPNVLENGLLDPACRGWSESRPSLRPPLSSACHTRFSAKIQSPRFLELERLLGRNWFSRGFQIRHEIVEIHETPHSHTRFWVQTDDSPDYRW